MRAWVLLSHVFFFCIENIHPQRQFKARSCQICCIHFIQRFIFKNRGFTQSLHMKQKKWLSLLALVSFTVRKLKMWWQTINEKCTTSHLLLIYTRILAGFHHIWYRTRSIYPEHISYNISIRQEFIEANKHLPLSPCLHIFELRLQSQNQCGEGFCVHFYQQTKNRLIEWDTIWKNNERNKCK